MNKLSARQSVVTKKIADLSESPIKTKAYNSLKKNNKHKPAEFDTEQIFNELTEDAVCRIINKLWSKFENRNTIKPGKMTFIEHFNVFMACYDIERLSDNSLRSNSLDGGKLLKKTKFWVIYIGIVIESTTLKSSLSLFREAISYGCSIEVLFEYFKRWANAIYEAGRSVDIRFTELPIEFQRMVQDEEEEPEESEVVHYAIKLEECPIGDSPLVSKCSQTIHIPLPNEIYIPFLNVSEENRTASNFQMNLSIIEEETEVQDNKNNQLFEIISYDYENLGCFAVLKKKKKVYAIRLSLRENASLKNMRLAVSRLQDNYNAIFLPANQEVLSLLEQHKADFSFH